MVSMQAKATKREKYRGGVLLLGGLLVLEVVMLVAYNFTLSKSHMDPDMAKLYTHVVEMARNHKLIIPNWNYTTTLEWDCATIFALPLYYVTKDIWSSFAIANTIFLLLFLFVLYMLLANKSILHFLSTAAVLFIPFSVGMLDYANMMFFNGSQYIVKVLLPLMLVALVIHDGKKNQLLHKVLAALYIVFLMINTISSGLYVAICAMFPIMLGYVVYRGVQKEQIEKRVLFWFGITISVIVIGMLVQKNLGINTRMNSMVLCSRKQIHTNISECIIGIFTLFGGTNEDMVIAMSVNGVKTFACILFVLFLLISVICSVNKIIRRRAGIEELLMCSVFLWNTLILFCIRMADENRCEYRYHLISMVGIICMSVPKIIDWLYKECKYKYVVGTVLYAFIAFISFASFVNMKGATYDVADLKACCEYNANQRIEVSYVLNVNNDADLCRLLSYKNGTVLAVDEESGLVSAVDWYKTDYVLNSWDDTSLIVSCDYPQFYLDEFELWGHSYKLAFEEGFYRVYR